MYKKVKVTAKRKIVNSSFEKDNNNIKFERSYLYHQTKMMNCKPTGGGSPLPLMMKVTISRTNFPLLTDNEESPRQPQPTDEGKHNQNVSCCLAQSVAILQQQMIRKQQRLNKVKCHQQIE
jgi:hypothetical protein